MKTIVVITLLLLSAKGIGQVSYSGHLDKSSITLILDYYDGEKNVQAYYLYNKYDEPININGTIENNELKLFEKKANDSILATLIFYDYHKTNKSIKGKWINADSSKVLDITLNRDFWVDSEDTSWKTAELIEEATNGNQYFKTIITKEVEEYSSGDSYTSFWVSGIKVFEKGTDRLIQSIYFDTQNDLKCTLLGLHNIDIEDYNFDGIYDFSIFESFYAGSNTSRKYFLYDDKTKEYFDSGFSGTSLEFGDGIVYETNRCCAGRLETDCEYIIVNNEMIRTKEQHFEMNDTGEMVLKEEHCYNVDKKTGEQSKIECN